MSLAWSEGQNVEDYTSENCEVDEDLHHSKNRFARSCFDTVFVWFSFVFELIISEHSKAVRHDMLSEEHVHEESTDLVAAILSNLERHVSGVWLLIGTIALVGCPLTVKDIAKDEATYLHLKNGFCVIKDGGILDQIKLIGFTSTLVIEIGLGDVTNEASFDPVLGIFFFDVSFVCDVFVPLFGQTNFQINSFNHHDPFFPDKVFLGILVAFQINILNNLLNHEAQFQIFKLVTIVHSDSKES